MKILAISDEECPALWDGYTPERLAGYDLILSSGDLNSTYLSFLVTMSGKPLLYVHGNHDITYDRHPPEGCDCIDGKLVVCKGIRILGLGGCLKYHPSPHQYTDEEMARRIRRLKGVIRRAGGVDIVVTHAPPKGVGDAEDRAHLGFTSLLELMDQYHPKYLLHGHVHMRYGHDLVREREYHGTKVINVCERYTLDYREELAEIPRHPLRELIGKSVERV